MKAQLKSFLLTYNQTTKLSVFREWTTTANTIATLSALLGI
jgi:hypothetical protein